MSRWSRRVQPLVAQDDFYNDDENYTLAVPAPGRHDE